MAKILLGNREGLIFTLLFFILLLVSACADSNPQSLFNSITGRHPANWSNHLAIGQNDFHASPVKIVQSTSTGAILYSKRCALCHGEGGTGKIGPPILAVADLGLINVAIDLIPLMKGQADLSQADRQAIADYIVALRNGAQPVSSVLQTDNCTECHGRLLDGGIAAVSCFSCHDGLDGAPVHRTAWLFSPSDRVNFHARYGGSFNTSCTTCHGVNFGGGIGPACALCHNNFVAPILNFIPKTGPPEGQLSTILTNLSGAQEVPPVDTPGTGTATLTVDFNTGAISGSVAFSGLTANANAAHIHQGAAGVNGPVIVPLTGGAGATAGTWTIPPGTTLTTVQRATLRSDGLYFNIHTDANPGGEIRGQIIFASRGTLDSSVILSGAQEVPPVATPGTGAATLTVDLVSGAVRGAVAFSGLTSNAIAAHIHQGAAGVNGPVALPLTGGAGATAGAWTIPEGSVLTADQLAALKSDGLYFNIHTETNPDGEIRGQIIFAGTLTLNIALSGAQEVPPLNIPGSGTSVLTIDLDTGAISGSITFAGLTASATAAHIHQGAAGVNGPVIIPLTGGLGATSGTWTVPAGTVLTPAQITALRANELYINIHTATNPGGEIRGQLVL